MYALDHVFMVSRDEAQIKTDANVCSRWIVGGMPLQNSEKRSSFYHTILREYRQAIDRVHRLGQERNVFVKHFIIARTVEQRILAIQARKTAMVSSALVCLSVSISQHQLNSSTG